MCLKVAKTGARSRPSAMLDDELDYLLASFVCVQQEYPQPYCQLRDTVQKYVVGEFEVDNGNELAQKLSSFVCQFG